MNSHRTRPSGPRLSYSGYHNSRSRSRRARLRSSMPTGNPITAKCGSRRVRCDTAAGGVTLRLVIAAAVCSVVGHGRCGACCGCSCVAPRAARLLREVSRGTTRWSISRVNTNVVMATRASCRGRMVLLCSQEQSRVLCSCFIVQHYLVTRYSFMGPHGQTHTRQLRGSTSREAHSHSVLTGGGTHRRGDARGPRATRRTLGDSGASASARPGSTGGAGAKVSTLPFRILAGIYGYDRSSRASTNLHLHNTCRGARLLLRACCRRGCYKI